jgi:hypothetical protein
MVVGVVYFLNKELKIVQGKELTRSRAKWPEDRGIALN